MIAKKVFLNISISIRTVAKTIMRSLANQRTMSKRFDPYETQARPSDLIQGSSFRLICCLDILIHMKNNYLIHLSVGILLLSVIVMNACSQNPDRPAAKTASDTAPALSAKDAANDPWRAYVKPSKEDLKKKLTPMQYKVTQEGGTEPPFRNEYADNKKEGIYVDIVSGEPLFSSTDKFDSGTGWPSFTKPLEPGNIVEKEDRGVFTTKTEVRSKHADSHLGDVFRDGPKPRRTALLHGFRSSALHPQRGPPKRGIRTVFETISKIAPNRLLDNQRKSSLAIFAAKPYR